MTSQEVEDVSSRMISPDEKIMLASGFEDAFLGIGRQFTKSPVAVYDKSKCLHILQQTMSEEEALECFDFNVQGAYVGESTPIFVDLI